jgi:hypothetical protein
MATYCYAFMLLFFSFSLFPISCFAIITKAHKQRSTQFFFSKKNEEKRNKPKQKIIKGEKNRFPPHKRG